MSRGIVYVAFGKEYDRLAAHTIAYSRRFTNLPILVLTNMKQRCLAWNGVKDIQFIEFDLTQYENRHIKTSLIKYTPFDETLYIDADALIQREGVEKLFDMLGNADILVCKCHYWTTILPNLYKKALLLTDTKLPLTIYHGGIWLCRRNEITIKLFDTWNSFWKMTGSGRDMPAFNCALTKIPLQIKEVLLEEHVVALDSPNEKCIIQHNYNTYQDKDFHRIFNLPKINECKLFDIDPKDWSFVTME